MISPIGLAWSRRSRARRAAASSNAPRPRDRVLLGNGEEQFEAYRWWFDRRTVCDREHDRDGGLVVGAEDCVVGVDPSARRQHRLDVGIPRDGIEMRGEGERSARFVLECGRSGCRRFHRPLLSPLSSSMTSSPSAVNSARDTIGDRPLIARDGRGDRADLREQVVPESACAPGLTPGALRPARGARV